ncbi:MAG: M48 family metallopeptidase [Parachlamydia sp.]|nr:M48 family metallopeptidase [Parachlamydia sp.]
MFTNLLFLIFVLLLASFSLEMGQTTWYLEPIAAFATGSLLYLALLGLMVLQNRLFKRASKNLLLAVANVECLLFFALFHFALGAHRIFAPAIFQMGTILFALLLYLAAIYVFHRSFKSGSSKEAVNQVALLIPFALPFLLFTIIVDLFQMLPSDNFVVRFMNETNPWLALIPSFLFLAAMLLFLPPLIVRLWRCAPLEDSPLKQRLEALCVRAHFAHGGFKTWGIMESSLTAAIVGVLPRLRYILFTPRLLNTFSPDAIEAILAHEIGHSYRRHLLYYPLIFFGMVLAIALFSEKAAPLIAEKFILQFGLSWSHLVPLLLFIPIALIVWLFFRFVYGFFSRIFERQADLHVYALGVSPEAMIEALDHVGTGTGFTHLVPNWHHYSIQERIDFLKETMRDPALIERHHKRVKLALSLYLGALTFLAAILFFYSGD